MIENVIDADIFSDGLTTEDQNNIDSHESLMEETDRMIQELENLYFSEDEENQSTQFVSKDYVQFLEHNYSELTKYYRWIVYHQQQIVNFQEQYNNFLRSQQNGEYSQPISSPEYYYYSEADVACMV